MCVGRVGLQLWLLSGQVGRLTQALEMRVVSQTICQGDRIIVPKFRVVEIYTFEVGIVVQRVCQPDGIPVADVADVLEGNAARDVLRPDLLLAAIARLHCWHGEKA
jgi:hypothetical protein